MAERLIVANVVYTANIDGYDVVPALRASHKRDWRALCFQDQVGPASGWTFGALPEEEWWSRLIPPAKAKVIKIMPWLVLGDDWEQCVWVDANIAVQKPLDDMPTGPFVTLQQRSTDQFYRELRSIQSHPRGYLEPLRELIREKTQEYRDLGIPEKDRTGGICTRWVYRQNTPSVKAFCEAVLHRFLMDGIWRDQVAWRVAAEQTGFNITRVSVTKAGIKMNCHHGGRGNQAHAINVPWRTGARPVVRKGPGQ